MISLAILNDVIKSKGIYTKSLKSRDTWKNITNCAINVVSGGLARFGIRTSPGADKTDIESCVYNRRY